MATSLLSKVAQLFEGDPKKVISMLFDSRVEELIIKSLEDIVSEDRKLQLVEIGRNWDYYYGDHEKYFKKYLGETDEEYADKDKPEFNYTRLVIDEYVKGVMGQGVTIKVDDPAVQTWWDELTKTFNYSNFMKKVQRIAELSYDCAIIPRWDDVLKRVYFEEVRGEYIKYYPDPENPRQVGSIAISYLYDSGLADTDRAHLLKRAEIWSPERIMVIEYSPRLQRRRIVFDEANPYKDENGEQVVPISIFRPDEDDNTFYGYGNAGDVSKINYFYNNVWMNLMRIVLFQSFSILFLKSATKLKVEIAPTRFLKTNDPDADAQYVTPSAKIEEVRKVREDFKNELLDISRIPVEVLSGTRKELPASGFSLQVKRMPIENLWTEKKENYRDPIKDMLRYAKIVQNTHGKTVGVKNKRDELAVLYSDPKVPIETATQQLQDAFDLEHGLTSPVELYMARHEVSRKEAEKQVLTNLEETKKVKDALGLGEVKGKATDFLSKLTKIFGEEKKAEEKEAKEKVE